MSILKAKKSDGGWAEIHSVKAMAQSTNDFTQDATATANDMAEGVTAYAQGTKITGTIPAIDDAVAEYPDCDIAEVEEGIYVVKHNDTKYIRTAETYDVLWLQKYQLGDATTGDVISGKTFTSANGLRLTGTIPTRESGKTYTISTKDGVVTLPYGYYGSQNNVQISSSEKNKIISSNIRSGVSILGVNGTYTGSGSGGSIDDLIPAYTYTVDPIPNAAYGFAINTSGYYASQNTGANNSYAICRVNINVTKTTNIEFIVINYAEANYDFGIFSNLNSALTLSYIADTSYYKSFKNLNMTTEQSVVYNNVAPGTYFIDIKFIKDQSQNKNNDALWFKVKSPLSQEVLTAISQADPDLVSSNIKSGIEIFGVTGTLVSGSGTDTSDATAVATDIADGKTAYVNGSKITGTVSTYTSPTWTERTPTVEDNAIKMTVNGTTLCRTKFSMSSPLTNFGNATAADVASGKTFTSSAGLLVTGTGSAGKLPNGVTHLASGSVTPSSDVAGITVGHNLGIIPNFIIWQEMGTNKYISDPGYTRAVTGSAWVRPMIGTVNGSLYSYAYTYKCYNSQGTLTGSHSSGALSSYFTTTDARLLSNASYPFKAGATYKWVCGYMNID